VYFYDKIKDMKTKVLFLAVSSLLLTGCSLVSSSTDGGVFRSDDGGKNFVQKVTIDEKTKIGSIDILSLAVNPQNGNEIYIGTAKSGIFKTTDAGEKWQVLKISTGAVGKAYAIAIDPINVNTVYAASVVGGRGKILKSTDAGENWKEVYTEPSIGSFVLALAIDSAGSGKIFGGTTEGQIIFSDNSGDTWKNMYKAQAGISKIAIDSMNSNLAYFGVSQGGLIRTRDGGKNFEDLSENGNLNGQQQFGSSTAIAVDPNRTGWVYVGTTTGLFRSKNGGDGWESVKVLNSLKENLIRGIAINSQNSDEIIYGAAQAFYKSVDGGQSWATTQLGGSRTTEVVAYNRQKPGVIYVGMNKR
jgi:photosystem II stability/assembly factor-like uncharacterized protein